MSGYVPNSSNTLQTNFNMEQAQKQLALLSAASQQRLGTRPGVNTSSMGLGGTNSGTLLGGTLSENGHPNFPSSSDSNVDMAEQHRRKNIIPFLRQVAQLMMGRNTPLPPQFTGHPTPTYNENTSPFKSMEIPDVGYVRLDGRDIDIYKLWTLVIRNGGSAVVSAGNGWAQMLGQLDLPESSSQILPNGTSNFPSMIQALFVGLLGPSEEQYLKSAQKAMSLKQGQMNQPPGTSRLVQAMQPLISGPPIVGESSGDIPMTSDSQAMNSSDADTPGVKRKLESDDSDGKRTRQKTEPLDATVSSTRIRQKMPTRRKIEYIPIARDVDTYGGRDLRNLEESNAQRRQPKEMSEWGAVDVDHLMMSIRSRIPTELSYALTTITLLSTMKGPTPGSGFPVDQCPELVEELLDLIEDLAFDGKPDIGTSTESAPHIITQREIVDRIREVEESSPFSDFQDPMKIGLRQRPGDIVVFVVNILRNLVVVPNNLETLCRNMRFHDLSLRLGCVTLIGNIPTPVSPHLTLCDLLTIRKDTLTILGAIANSFHFPREPSPSPTTSRIAQRAYTLIASYLVDPVEAVCPLYCLQLAGATADINARPPSSADAALDVLTRLGHFDHNRRILSRSVPLRDLWSMVVALVHRLPMLDIDYQLIMREPWLTYVERIIMAMFIIVFLVPPEMKHKVKTDRGIRFKDVMLRMVRRLLVASHQLPPNQRGMFMPCVRRAVESMKVVDDGADSFDTSQAAPTTLSFGMGFSEVGEGSGEEGTGMLGGNREIAWELLMLGPVAGDEVIFTELESMARVE